MVAPRNTTPLFPLGRLMVTPAVARALSPGEISAAIDRHVLGDWGEVDPEDWRANDLSVREGTRILSAYRSRDGRKFWIITEDDRSATTLLWPDEY